jgi:hypothetical protein
MSTMQRRTSRLLHFAITFALLALLAGSALVSAQPNQALTVDWLVEDYNFASRMMDTDQGDNVFVVGDTAVGDYLVIKKFNAAGVLLWQTTYRPTERLRGVWIAADSAGNAIVLATIIQGSSDAPTGWVTLKYDGDGNLLWANSLPGPVWDARRVEVDSGNNIYVAGRMWLTNASGNTTYDSVLIKYSPDGATLWTKVFDDNSAMDEPFALVISPDSSRIGVAGMSGNLFMALMYDPDGNLVWSNSSLGAYAANDLAFGPGNISYFATGTYHLGDPNPYQMAVARFDASGNLAWIKSYSVGDRSFRVRVDGQGNVVATGMDAVGYMDWMTIKTDAGGNLLWAQRYDGGRNNSETPNMLALDESGAVYVTGTGGPNPSSGTISYLKGVVAKYSSDGTPQWAVWDPYAGGKAFALGAGTSVTSLGFGYLVTARYTQTGLPDLAPAAPTNLTGSAVSGSEIRLNYVDNAANEFWVEAERCAGAGCTDFVTVAQSRGEDAAWLSDKSVSRGVTYTYRVRALGFIGPSPYSNTVEVTVPAASPPAAPSNLTAEMSDGYVVLNWQDNSINENQFFVERCEGAGCASFVPVGSSNLNVPTWTDYFVAGGRSYSYRVRASNSDGDSGYSNIASIVTPGGPPAPLAAPTNLSAQPVNKSQIRLTWTNNSANQEGVKIERCQDTKCANFVQIAIVAGTGATYNDLGLAANTTYQYRTRAYYAAGDSPYSNIATAKTLKK